MKTLMLKKSSIIESWPIFSKEEIQAVSDVLHSGRVNYWTGEQGKLFEQEFADYIGCKYAVALANGTLALELVLNVLGIGSGDEVIVPSRTFIATASAVVARGAKPVIADVDRESGNITIETIEMVRTTRTRAIIVVHLGGWPCDMGAIMPYARKHNLLVVEDCAQAHGAKYKGRKVGSFGDAAAFSFCQDKIMTTGGEGGMVTTNDRNLWSRMWSYKDHGKSWEAVYEVNHPPGFRWLHESFGSNLRMTEMQSAIGRVQLRKMPKWHSMRKHNAEAIMAACDDFPSCLRVPRSPAYVEHAWYKCYVFVRPKAFKRGWDRNRIMSEIEALGVPCFAGSCSEIYLEKAFDGSGFRPKKRLPVAKELGETSLMFLVHPSLTKDQIEMTCSVIRNVMMKAAR